MAITFFKKEIEAPAAAAKGTQAMLVNLSVQMAIESIAELNRLGITQIEFIPVSPGAAYPPMWSWPSPGEVPVVPPTALRVMDLGPRVFTADTLLEIALALGFTWFPASPAFRSYADSLADPGQSLASLWSARLKTETYLDILMGALETGILGVDTEDRVFALNSVAESMLGLRRENALNRPLSEACRTLDQQLQEGGPSQRPPG